MTKITTDLVGGETAEVTKQRFTDILEYWGYDPDGYQTFAEARRDFNELLAGTALGGILGSELASSFKAKINLTNDPAGLLSARLFDDGSAGIFLDASDISTLFQDTAGAVPVTAPGQTVARINDRSGNGNHATQATAGSRPTYGIVPETGRRNLATQTEDLSSAQWSKVNTTIVGGDTVLTSTGLGARSCSREPSTIGGISAGQTRSVSIELQGAGVRWLQIYLNSSVGQGWVFIDMENGVAGNFDAGIRDLTVSETDDGWISVSFWFTYTTGNQFLSFRASDVNGSATGATFTSTGVEAWRMRKLQFEVGTTPTPYQRVGTQFDVTEAGVPSLPHLFKLSGNTLNATLPDLGTNATVAYVSDAGVNIMTGQTIGAGSFDVLRDQRLFAMIVIERPFTSAETGLVTDYFERIGLKT